jgi:hypothetical protein
MDEHIILYIDFLGSKAAIRDWKEEQLEAFATLLHNIAALRSEFASLTETHVEGGTRSVMTPAVSTFSDHIVISYPTEHLRRFGGESSLSLMGLFPAQTLAAQIAAKAMSFGLLIRGGVTVGQLHHKGGVVLGKAMIEAYELESSVSIYPRIAASRKLYSLVKANPPTPLSALDTVLLEDQDGITHLNYFKSMIWAGGGQRGDDFKARLNTWLTEARQTVAANIEKFEQDERWNELAKWVWFRKHLEQGRASYPSAVSDAMFDVTITHAQAHWGGNKR